MIWPEIWLSIDLASSQSTVALHSLNDTQIPLQIQEELVGERSLNSDNLILKLKYVLDQNQIELGRVTRFITSAGPGSFTGIRLAYSTIKAFALSTNATIEVVSGTEVRALAWFRQNNHTQNKVIIGTQIGTDRYFKDTYQWRTGELCHLSHQRVSGSVLFSGDTSRGGEICLIDRNRQGISATKFLVFPLTASHLGDMLPFCKTRKSYAGYRSWLPLVPQYDGEEWGVL